MRHLPSIILQTLSRYLFFIVTIVSLYLLIKGHQLPGGGFVGGLSSAIALSLFGMTLPIERVQALLPIDPFKFAFFGFALIILTGCFPLLIQLPFLTHYPFDINTPLLFDTGIYLIVLGIVTKLLFSLRKVILKRFTVNEKEFK
ncbi:MAG: Na(+)/H(+) antiporter subunit B [Chlamydiia bacterium]|nr:Na(+)/H(+) antiporter subunit B [Chlamydiia bacterium]